jgi:MoaA/NifB/PqqE/SkfB family radical SAM enzyme
VDTLSKIYVEPTSRCNLKCVTCVRHSWEEPLGEMPWAVYESLMRSLDDLPEAKTVSFMGFGEPLLHRRLPEMIGLASARGLRTEITSNATLLTEDLGRRLIEAGLDQFTVSIDGALDSTHCLIRPGAGLEALTTNVSRLYWLSEETRPTPVRVGIEFVAMRRNIRDLPLLYEVARAIRASFILVTNVLPYSEELREEILYRLGPNTSGTSGAPDDPLWILPHLDWDDETQAPLAGLMRQQPNVSFLDLNLTGRRNYCPFVQSGSVALGWQGAISPCPPLLHSYRCYIRERSKTFRRCEFGRMPGQSLKEIWERDEYRDFRSRVREFSFSPCTDCGGCDLSQTNEADCFGNPFPVCGDCLWARGVLRCA